jgi:hypothetical protein
MKVKNLWNLRLDPPVDLTEASHEQQHNWATFREPVEIPDNFVSKIYTFDFTDAEKIKQYTKVGWIEERSLELFLGSKIKICNSEMFSFKLTHFSECIEYREYDETYHNTADWFMDVQGNNTQRKLSAIMFLSGPEEYEGGDLWMITSTGTNIVEEKRKGSIIVFPSYLMYRFSEIKKGKLKILMFWAEGPNFV